MDRTQYWELIEQARDAVPDGDCDEKADAFVTALAEHGADEIADAWLRHRELMHDAYSWDVWGAISLLLGGCSDDSFDYFRSWLILQGREAFDAVIDDPDSLVDLVPDGELDENAYECEELEGAPFVAYEEVTGEQMPLHRDIPDEPDLGEEFDFDDDEEMKRRYPRLWARVNG